MKQICILLAICLVGMSSCNNATNTTNNNTSDSANAKPVVNRAPAQSKLTAQGTSMLMDVMAKYYALKNALVATNGVKADSAAMALTIAADSLQALLVKDTTVSASAKLYIDTLITQSKTIAATTDATCEKQRNALGPLSNAVYGLLKTVAIKNAGVYRDFCPMAYDEKGGFWLSEESEIKNPYFGKKMIECGEVQDSM